MHTVVFVAENRGAPIAGMGGDRPGAADVAVRDDRVSAVGTLEDVAIWGERPL